MKKYRLIGWCEILKDIQDSRCFYARTASKQKQSVILDTKLNWKIMNFIFLFWKYHSIY